MYIAYSNSHDYTVSTKLKPALRSEAKTINRSIKTIRFFAAIFILTLLFSFGAFVKAYAGNTESTNMNNLKVSSVSSSDNHSTEKPSLAAKKVIVNSGDTLWDIAAMHVPEGKNVRSYISNIKKLNGLTSSSIHEGDILILP